MDRSFLRGAAAALLAVGSGAPLAHAQVTAGSIQVRPGTRDSVVVRVIDANSKARIDSIMVIMRAIEEVPAFSDDGLRLRRELDAAVRSLSSVRGGMTNRVFIRTDGDEVRQVTEARLLKGWIGANMGLVPQEQISDSTGLLVHYFRYPLIVSVEPNSPAQRAGIAAGDVLVAYDGKDVVRNRLNMSELLVPERRLGVTVRRDGEPRDFTVVVAKPPERIIVRRAEPGEMVFFPFPGAEGQGGASVRGVPIPPGEPMRRAIAEGMARGQAAGAAGAFGTATFARPLSFERNGVFGAGLVTVNAELARVTKLMKGVLIQECPEETPAFKGGLRTGDVIVSVAGRQVNTVSDVLTMVRSRLTEKSAVFKVVRDKKPVSLNVTW